MAILAACSSFRHSSSSGNLMSSPPCATNRAKSRALPCVRPVRQWATAVLVLIAFAFDPAKAKQGHGEQGVRARVRAWHARARGDGADMLLVLLEPLPGGLPRGWLPLCTCHHPNSQPLPSPCCGLTGFVHSVLPLLGRDIARWNRHFPPNRPLFGHRLMLLFPLDDAVP